MNGLLSELRYRPYVTSRPSRGVDGVLCFVVLYGAVMCGQALGDEAVINAQEFVSAYERSLNAVIRRSVMDVQTHTRYEGAFEWELAPKEMRQSASLARDGRRHAVRVHAKRFYVGDSPEQPRIDQRMTGIATDRFYQYQAEKERPPSAVMVAPYPEKAVPTLVGASGMGCVLDGVIPGSTIPLPELLRGADSVSVRPETEQVDGMATFVVEADTPDGKCTLWLDAEHGYVPRRLSVRRTGEHHWYGSPLRSAVLDVPEGATPVEPRSAIVADELVMDSVKVESVDGQWVIRSARVNTVRTYENGQSTRSASRIERSAIDLSPDFEALRAFAVDVPNGTPVHLMLGQADSGIRLEWRDGQIGEYVDEEVVDVLTKQADKLRSQEVKPKESLPNVSSETTLPQSAGVDPGTEGERVGSVWAIVAGIVALLGVAGWAFMRRRSTCAARGEHVK